MLRATSLAKSSESFIALTSIFGVSYFTEEGEQAVPFSTEESIYLNCLGLLGSGLTCINADVGLKR